MSRGFLSIGDSALPHPYAEVIILFAVAREVPTSLVRNDE
jgi:hypothetical protein